MYISSRSKQWHSIPWKRTTLCPKQRIHHKTNRRKWKTKKKKQTWIFLISFAFILRLIQNTNFVYNFLFLSFPSRNGCSQSFNGYFYCFHIICMVSFFRVNTCSVITTILMADCNQMKKNEKWLICRRKASFCQILRLSGSGQSHG